MITKLSYESVLGGKFIYFYEYVAYPNWISSIFFFL